MQRVLKDSDRTEVDLGSLRLALLVVEHGSFRRAAEALGVRPSVVSRRVQGFEDAIGVSLFQRQSQGARPTVAGDRILRRGRAILDAVGQLLRSAELASCGAEGRLCVGVVASIAGGTARSLLHAFLLAHPGVELEIIEGSPRDHIAAVRALSMDVTFVVGTPLASGCELEALWSEPVRVALPASHALSAFDMLGWHQIAGERFMVSEVDPGPEIHDFVVRRLSALGRHPTVQPRPVRRDGLMAMVGLGVGISLVGAAEASVAYPAVAFRLLAGESLPFSAVWSTRNDNPALRRFLSLCRVQVGSLPRRAGDPPRALEPALLDAVLQTPGPPP